MLAPPDSCSRSTQCPGCPPWLVWTKVSTAKVAELRAGSEYTCVQGALQERTRSKGSPGRGREATLTLSCSSRLKLRASWSWTSSSGPQDGGWRRESMRGRAGEARARAPVREAGRPRDSRPGLSEVKKDRDRPSPESVTEGRESSCAPDRQRAGQPPSREQGARGGGGRSTRREGEQGEREAGEA